MTVCKRGHEWTEATTYINPKGVRICRKCKAGQQKEYIDRLTGRPTPAASVGYCSRCETTKPAGEFVPDRARPSGLRTWCKDCARDHELGRAYGLRPGEYARMREDQNGVCAICGRTPDDALCVDHDHDTSEVRGLLCRRCNAALGGFGDDPAMLMKALEYLMSRRTVTV